MRLDFSLFILFSVLVLHVVANQEILYHEDEVSTIIRLGPFTVPAGEMLSMYDSFTELGEEIDIRKGNIGMTGLDGRVLDDKYNIVDQDYLYLHHFFLNTGNSEDTYIFCPDYEGYQPIGGVGAELTEIHLPSPYYLEIPDTADVDWMYSLHVVNPNNEDKIFYFDVYLKYIEFSSVDVKVLGNFQTVLGCDVDDDEWNVEEGDGREYRFIDFVNTMDGEIIWASAHLHRGGLSLSLTDRETGENYFSGRAHYDNDEHPDWITSCDFQPGLNVRLQKGQKLRLASVYDNTEPHDEVMGVLLSYNVVDDVDTTPYAQITGDSWNGYEESNSSSILWVGISFILAIVGIVLGVLVSFYIWNNKHKFQKSTREPAFDLLEEEEEDLVEQL